MASSAIYTCLRHCSSALVPKMIYVRAADDSGAHSCRVLTNDGKTNVLLFLQFVLRGYDPNSIQRIDTSHTGSIHFHHLSHLCFRVVHHGRSSVITINSLRPTALWGVLILASVGRKNAISERKGDNALSGHSLRGMDTIRTYVNFRAHPSTGCMFA